MRKFFTILLTASTFALALCADPAAAQGKNTDIEVFGGGLTKNNPQGFAVGQVTATNPNSGSLQIRKDALQQVTWFKSRRQVSIEDDGPIVTDRRTGGYGGGGGRGALSPATFGGSNAMAGALGVNGRLQQANFGPVTRPQAAQARPIMRPGQLASAGKLGGPNNVSSAAPAPRPTASQANYGGYQASSGGGYESSSAHIREVKAKLLGTR